MTTIKGLWGAFLGLLLDIAGFPARALVFIFAIGGRYPWWMVTPDDPVSPFGRYEATTRAVYERFGRYAGDVYWLAWRNVLFGLAYKLKPAKYKALQNYSHLERSAVQRGRVTTFIVDGLPLWQINLGPFELLAGWMVRGAVLDPHTIRQPVNMEFRPVFSPRRAG